MIADNPGSHEDCIFCSKKNVLTGKDMILYEDSFCYIVENSNSQVLVGLNVYSAKRRVCLVLKEHKHVLTHAEYERAIKTLNQFLEKSGYERSTDYFIEKMMGIFPEHFHIRAYFPPFSPSGHMLSIAG